MNLARRRIAMPKTGVLWKVCGITDGKGASTAVRAGADALGFIFYPASPRSTTAAAAARIAAALPENIIRVGVFVNSPLHEIKDIREQVGLDAVQLSGDETPETCEQIGGQVWKALRIGPGCSLAEAEDMARPFSRWTLLLDAGAEGRYGGTAKTIDWDTAAVLAARHRLVLAGGLRPGNVASAAAQVRPWAVDVASGVEMEPGRKSEEKLQAFAAALRPFRNREISR